MRVGITVFAMMYVLNSYTLVQYAVFDVSHGSIHL